MGALVPHAAPSGANGSWWGRFYKHAGPNGPWAVSAAIEPHGRRCLAFGNARQRLGEPRQTASVTLSVRRDEPRTGSMYRIHSNLLS